MPGGLQLPPPHPWALAGLASSQTTEYTVSLSPASAHTLLLKTSPAPSLVLGSNTTSTRSQGSHPEDPLFTGFCPSFGALAIVSFIVTAS